MTDRIIKTYWIYSFLFTLGGAFTFAIYTLYLRANGLTFFESNLVNITFMIGITVFEIPTGIAGDWFGRKNALVASSLACIIGYIVYGSSTTILGFICAEVLVSIGHSFNSGAAVAWVKDNVDHFDNSRNLTGILTTSEYLRSVAAIGGGFFGNVMFDYNITLPWWMGVATFVACGIFAYRKMDEHIPAQNTFDQHWSEVFKESWKEISGQKNLIMLATMDCLLLGGYMSVNMSWAPFIKEVLNQNWLVKWAWPICAIGVMLGAAYAKKEQRSHPGLTIKTGIILLSFPLLLIPAVSSFLPFIGLIAMHEIGRGIIRISTTTYANDFLRAKTRATSLSLISIFEHVGAMLGLLLFGPISDHFGLSWTFFTGGVIIFISLLFVRQLHIKPR